MEKNQQVLTQTQKHNDEFSLAFNEQLENLKSGLQAKITSTNANMLKKFDDQEQKIANIEVATNSLKTDLLQRKNSLKNSVTETSFINTSSKSLFLNTIKDKDFGPRGSASNSRLGKETMRSKSKKKVPRVNTVQSFRPEEHSTI